MAGCCGFACRWPQSDHMTNWQWGCPAMCNTLPTVPQQRDGSEHVIICFVASLSALGIAIAGSVCCTTHPRGDCCAPPRFGRPQYLLWGRVHPVAFEHREADHRQCAHFIDLLDAVDYCIPQGVNCPGSGSQIAIQQHGRQRLQPRRWPPLPLPLPQQLLWLPSAVHHLLSSCCCSCCTCCTACTWSCSSGCSTPASPGNSCSTCCGSSSCC